MRALHTQKLTTLNMPQALQKFNSSQGLEGLKMLIFSLGLTLIDRVRNVLIKQSKSQTIWRQIWQSALHLALKCVFCYRISIQLYLTTWEYKYKYNWNDLTMECDPFYQITCEDGQGGIMTTCYTSVNANVSLIYKLYFKKVFTAVFIHAGRYTYIPHSITEFGCLLTT